MWKILVTGPNYPAQRRALAAGSTLVLGRAQDNDLVLPSDCVSRRHAQLSATAEGVRVSDLGSRNGTELNGHRLGKVSRLLEPGDVVSLGDYVVKVEAEGVVPRLRPRGSEGFVTLRTSALEDNPFLTRCDWRRPAPEPAPEPAAAALVSREVDPQYAPLLFELADRLAGGPELMQFLSEVLDCAAAVTGFEGGLLLRNAAGQLEPTMASSGLDPDAFTWSSTLLGEAVRRRATLFVNHLRTDGRFNAASSVLCAAHVHVVCTPLLRGEQVLGALYLATHSSQPPSQGAVDFVTAIAQLAATALAHERRAEEACGSVTAPMPALVTVHAPIEQLESSTRFLEGALTLMQQLVQRGADSGSAAEDMRALLDDARDAVKSMHRQLAEVASAVKAA
jgi:adenylate cyclase